MSYLSKPILYVDIDGVVADSVRWWLNLASVEKWKPFPFEKHTEYNTMKCLGVDLSPYYMDYRGVETVEGSRSALISLNVYYDIKYVTVGYGESWLRNQGFSGEVIHIKNRGLLRGYALIDDCEDNLTEFIGKKYLVQQPWNPCGWTWDKIKEDLLNDAHSNFTNGVLFSPV